MEKICSKETSKNKTILLSVSTRRRKITVASTRKLIKQGALEDKGNKCSRCGYDICSQTLEFHHLNMSEKDFSISDRDIKLDWDSIKKN